MVRRIPNGRLGVEVSLSPVCFGDALKSGEMTTEQFLDAAAKLGFRAVELCDRSLRRPDRILEQLSSRGLAMPSIALRNDFTGPPAEVECSIRHLHQWLGIAASLGCRVARVWTGWQRSDTTARAQIHSAFDAVVPVARALGVRLALETHGGLSNDPGFVQELHVRHGDALGACLDFGNLPADRRQALIARFVPMTMHVHVKAFEFDRSGNQPTIPLRWAIDRLRAAGFRGQWVVEYEGPPPYEEGIRLTVEALRWGAP